MVKPLDYSQQMSFLDKFRKSKPTSPTPQACLPGICWSIAYVILPHYAFEDCDKFVSICMNRVFTTTSEALDPAGMFFYFMGCQAHKVAPTKEDGFRFRVHHGPLDDARDYYVLEYPPPPPLDLTHIDPTTLTPEQRPVLAPYFSVVVRHRQTKAVGYYVLGQAPIGGGTTLRSVTPDGANCNHGPGPEPRLDSFLARLRTTGGEIRTFGAWKT